MSIRTYVKAAAIALPMMAGGAKASAQTVKSAVQHPTTTVAAADTLKTMSKDAKHIVGRYRSQYSANIKNNKVVDSNVNYEETGKVLSNATTKTIIKGNGKNSSFKADAGLVHGVKLPSVGYRVAGEASRNNDAFQFAGVVSRKSFGPQKKEVHMVGDIAYQRSFPIKNVEGLSATGKVGVEGAMIKKDGHDSYGAIYPNVTAGLKFNKKFSNNVKIGAKADAGVAQPVYYRTQSINPSKNIKAIANAEIEAGYKNVSAFVSGGHDAHMGGNIGGGVRFTF